MNHNIEIKARITDLYLIRKKVEGIATSGPIIIHQEDTFFPCHTGRLKLRKFSAVEGELISYHRPDSVQPKECQYIRTPTTHPDLLCETLTKALGVKGVVRKIRTLFMVGQTRIHLDEVENLGTFLELEVVLNPEQTIAEGVQIAEVIMEKLGIEKEDLMGEAYVDLLHLTPTPLPKGEG